MDNQKRYITVEDAASLAGVSPSTIRNWLNWKVIKGIRVQKNPDSVKPGKWFVERESLEEAIEEGRI